MSIGLTKTEACVSRGLGMLLGFFAANYRLRRSAPVQSQDDDTGHGEGGWSHGHQNCHLAGEHCWQHGTGQKVNKKYFECRLKYFCQIKNLSFDALQNTMMSRDVIQRWQFWSPELRDLTMVYGWIKESGSHNSRVDYQFTIGHSWSPGGPGHQADRSRVSRPISAWESADQSQSQTHKSERDRGKLLGAGGGEGGGGGGWGRRQSQDAGSREEESDCNQHLINRFNNTESITASCRLLID